MHWLRDVPCASEEELQNLVGVRAGRGGGGALWMWQKLMETKAGCSYNLTTATRTR